LEIPHRTKKPVLEGKEVSVLVAFLQLFAGYSKVFFLNDKTNSIQGKIKDYFYDRLRGGSRQNPKTLKEFRDTVQLHYMAGVLVKRKIQDLRD
jgi:hypothetical protein